MTIWTKLFARTLAPLFVTATLAGWAGAQPGGEGGGHRHGMPPAMLEACKDKKAGDACEVSFGEHKATGKCGAAPDGKLVCHIPPPVELIKACEGKKEGDDCSATTPERKVSGTCRKGRMDDRLVCRPAWK